VDKLKKENLALEKQLTHLKVENANAGETSAQLQSQREELETAAESYKRQTHRLMNENDALIKQMESLEVEMKRKEDQTSRKQIVIFRLSLFVQRRRITVPCVCACVRVFPAIILYAL
jgi:septal ring factor EnvC (AmiA/AmiB activator)